MSQYGIAEWSQLKSGVYWILMLHQEVRADIGQSIAGQLESFVDSNWVWLDMVSTPAIGAKVQQFLDENACSK